MTLAACLADQRRRADGGGLPAAGHRGGELRHGAGRGAGAGPGERGDPADPDPADAAGDAAHAGPVHLRHQRAAVLVRRLVRRGLRGGRVLVGRLPARSPTASFPGRCRRCCCRRAAAPHDRPHLQLRVLPAAHARGQGQAARHLAAARAAEAEVLLGHLRRRRLDAGRHAGHGARDPARRLRGRAAHFLRRLDAGRDRRDPRAVQGERHPPHRRAARRPALGRGDGGRAALRERAGRVHPRDAPATGSTSRSAATPSTTRRRATPRTR